MRRQNAHVCGFYLFVCLYGIYDVAVFFVVFSSDLAFVGWVLSYSVVIIQIIQCVDKRTNGHFSGMGLHWVLAFRRYLFPDLKFLLELWVQTKMSLIRAVDGVDDSLAGCRWRLT